MVMHAHQIYTTEVSRQAEIIAAGTRVRIDRTSDHPRAGRVIGLLTDISNGRHAAVVELDGPLPGLLEQVWLERVTPESVQ